MNLADCPENTDWEGMIQEIYGMEEDETEKCFECLDKFLKDLSELGLEQIIAKHAEHEKKKYGFLSSSRLRNKREDQVFYDSLNDEVKSEKRKKDGCRNNRIKYSALCRDHHFAMVKNSQTES